MKMRDNKQPNDTLKAAPGNVMAAVEREWSSTKAISGQKVY